MRLSGPFPARDAAVGAGTAQSARRQEHVQGHAPLTATRCVSMKMGYFMSLRAATNALTAATSMGAFVKMPSELNATTLTSGACVRAMAERSQKTARQGWERRAGASSSVEGN